MRFGQGLSWTDNTSGGGFSVAVNGETGALEGPGRQEITKGAGVFYEHPDTHFKFDGFSIPYFKEACDLVKNCAQHFPSRLIGWDIAITEEGPVVIEGNHNPGLHVSDMAYGGYMKHPLIKEILDEINN
jgi:D-alanine-D-alanine ligase-like ATP-grasp enzyme